ncbi:MAG TPA: protein kinase [Thermoanaerobaculia bacterium]|nr:protein kinase [Thermoanaerobaculia bacterium]
MTLAVGTRLGPYEIQAPLGAGGMGEVYRARDTRLGREVAIKVLPSERAADPERRRRFEQEARSASALNHPNILTIHEIGTEGDTTYIAMELVEGRTLRELVAAGPIPVRRLLDLATQVAEGLAKAHAAGIVHRDLKPENVMVSADGYVKILDFGLAKLVEPISQELSVLPTAAGSPTEPGTVLGTAGYMSPEQAGGRPLDFHSDQFAFGSILYEMATGKRAFQRKTGAETLVAIMREEPEPIAASSPAAPAPLRWIVERCLMKEPEDRYASTKDLARDLASMRDHLSETSVSATSGAIEPVKARRKGWLLPAAIALAGLAAGLLLRGALADGKTPGPPHFQQITYQRGTIFSARFAPDGQTIAYGAAWDGRPLEIYSARLDSPESRPMGLPPADVLSISKTGEMAISLGRHYLAGYESTGTLARVSLGGGAPRPVLENVQDADWAPDGQSLAVARHVGNLQRLEYPIGKAIYSSSGWVSSVRVSPDGRFVAFIDHPTRGDNDGRLRIVDAEGKVRVEGPIANLGVAWSPRGDEVWSSAPLAVTNLSGKTRQPYDSPGVDILHDVSKDGRVLMSLVSARREIVGVPADGSEHNLTWLNWSFPTDITRDGRTLIFDEQNVVPAGVYLRPIDGSGPAVKLGEGFSFGLSPDGRFALNAPKPAATQLVLLPIGAGESKRLAQSNVVTQAATFFPDGKRILVAGNEPGRGIRLYVQDLPDGKPRAITPEGVSTARTISPVSPDGKLIAAYGPDAKLALYPAEPGEPHPVPGVAAEDVPLRWSADGRSLYVFRQSAPPGKIELLDLATGRRTPWKEFRPPDPAGILQVGPVVVAPDGSSYVYSYRRLLDELYVANGLH